MVCCQIVMLFFLMLTERRVILMSSHPSVLSDCAHALNSLLYPFQWEHIYVPILVPKVREPRVLLCYVCIPAIMRARVLETVAEAIELALNAKPSVMARYAYTSRELLAACSMCHIQAAEGHGSNVRDMRDCSI